MTNRGFSGILINVLKLSVRCLFAEYQNRKLLPEMRVFGLSAGFFYAMKMRIKLNYVVATVQACVCAMGGFFRNLTGSCDK